MAFSEILDRKTCHGRGPSLEAAKTAANLAFFVSGSTAFLWSLSVLKMPATVLIDAGLFAVVGIGIRCMWRSASVIGLLLYLAKVGNGIAHAPGLVVVSILTTLIFANDVRGTIAYRKLATPVEPASVLDTEGVLETFNLRQVG